jgi:chemotaxis regulatin CheY-phosphate phosphatase CheZ
MYLEEICADNRRLQMVVDHQPSISHLDDSGHTLFMRYVGLLKRPLEASRTQAVVHGPHWSFSADV